MDETVLPVAEEPKASDAPKEEPKEAPADNADTSAEAAASEQPKEEAKPEKTPAERELERARRKIDRLVRQREELRAQVGRPPVAQSAIEEHNQGQAGDSDELKLSRAQLQELVKAEAEKLAPTLAEQRAAIEHRQKLVQTLAKDWGQEKFDALASDLDAAFDGLTDRNGRPKPATDALFEADDPKALIEYLADPDHEDEADALSRLGPIQAGRAIAKLESKLAAAKDKAKPEASKAPAPLEPVRAQGAATKDPGTMTDAEFAAWRRRQIAQRR